MEIFCLGGFAVWILCVVLLAMMSAAVQPTIETNKAQANLKTRPRREKLK